MLQNDRISGTEGLDLALELERVKAEFRDRESVIHQLNAQYARERIKLASAHSDIEAMSFWLDGAERRASYFERRTPSGFLRALWKRFSSPKPAVAMSKRDVGAMASPPDVFRYYLRISPYRIYREPTFALEGWAMPESGVAVTGMRARVDEKEFWGTYGIEESYVPEWHRIQPNNPLPGFKIIVETPPGRHRLAIEAQLGDSRWHSLINIPIWSVGTSSGPLAPLE